MRWPWPRRLAAGPRPAADHQVVATSWARGRACL